MYDQKLGGERAERQRAEQAAVVRRQMAEFERNFRAKLGSCSAQVWAQLFAVHYGDAAAAAASETILNDLRARGDRLGLGRRSRHVLPFGRGGFVRDGGALPRFGRGGEGGRGCRWLGAGKKGRLRANAGERIGRGG